MNPWPVIGGVANVVCHESEYVQVNQGQPGDILVLTKPLGTQVAVNLNEWLIEKNDRWTSKASKLFSEERAKEAYYMAVESMSVLNLGAASIMKRHGCHGATDITGFGIKGHAKNLVEVQKEAVDYNIHSLPIIDGMDIINKEVFNFRLIEGYSAETSGGLLIMVPPEKVQAFQDDLEKEYGQKSWIVGNLTTSLPDAPRKVHFGENDDSSNIKIINVEQSFMADEE